MHYVLSLFIVRVAVYPLDSVIHPLKDWAQIIQIVNIGFNKSFCLDNWLNKFLSTSFTGFFLDCLSNIGAYKF